MIKIFEPVYPYQDWPKKWSQVLIARDRQEFKDSGWSEKTALDARAFSADESLVCKLLGRWTSVGSGWVLPYPSPDGFYEGRLCVKLHTPVVLASSEEGKTAKYLFPVKSEPHIYFPRSVWPIIDDVRVPLIFVEGQKKALKASQEGFPSVALSGVWGWSRNHKPIEDFNLIALKGRVVHIVFDADKFTNPHVFLAERRFAEMLLGRGAIVKIVNLPKENV
jgi:hypothetical protein